MVADELSSEALHGDALFEGFGGEGGVEAEEFIALFGDGGPVNLVRFSLLSHVSQTLLVLVQCILSALLTVDAENGSKS